MRMIELRAQHPGITLPSRGEKIAAKASSPTFIFQNLANILKPMQLNDEDIQEFINIWQSVFHEQISVDEARKCAPAVMELYALLAKPKEEFGRLQDLENRNDEVFSLLQKIQRG
jgi:hypothetical protein